MSEPRVAASEPPAAASERSAASEPSAEEVIALLSLEKHPEGGYYRETYRHQGEAGSRGAGTAIYFLLKAGQRSHYHKVDAAEIWHYYAGAPLTLLVSTAPGQVQSHRLGPSLLKGERPQLVVPPDAWQSAESEGEWTLVGCTVSPAFEFEHFVLAPPDFEP